MTRRPMLLIAALAVAVGAVVSAPTVAAGAPGARWRVNIDGPTGDVASRRLVVTGTAARDGLGILDPDSVTVTVAPQGLPPACGPDVTGTARVERDHTYAIPLDVRCNGRYQIRVVARGGQLLDPGPPATRDVRVAERPARPSLPGLAESGEGGLTVTWQGSGDIDAAGWVVRFDGGELTFGPEVVRASLPPASRRSPVAVRALRWGAEGPGTTPVASDFSPANALPPSGPGAPPDPDPPAAAPPPNDPSPPRASPPGRSSRATPPPTTTGGPPARRTGASSTTLPEGYSEELPFGVTDGAFVPGDESNPRPSSEVEERAVSTGPPGGLVRTREERRSPGLVAPFALGLLMITVAAHIGWYLRRSRPTAGGEGRPV